jgi:hypothetical protein
MSPPRLKTSVSTSKLSIISLSSFETIENQFISYPNNTNYSDEKKLINSKSFNQTIDQAVEYFEQILNQCANPSSTSLLQNIDQPGRQNDIKSKLETKKPDCERLLNKKENFKNKQREQKINCRKWCEEQNAKYSDSIDDNDRTYQSKKQNSYGSKFYCRKALLQKPDGVTYICIRKRID